MFIPDLHTDFLRGRSGGLPHKNFPQFVVIHTVKGFGIVNKAHIQGAAAAWAQEGLEEILHVQVQEGWP